MQDAEQRTNREAPVYVLGPGAIALPEKSGFPEEAFLGRVWCSDRDVMTWSPLPWPTQLGCVPRPAYSPASSPAQVWLGLDGVDLGSEPFGSLLGGTVPRRLPKYQAGAASAFEAQLFPQGLGWGHSGLLGQLRALVLRKK